ncbi:MAG: MATE family efflux transporter [Alphaproteobacteria bacterium]|nr:MATE family efflux transporter [Alphaproteobacteria bacterium]
MSHYLSTIALSIPLIIGQVAMIGVWTADIVMMGSISADALAAGTQASRLYQPLYFIAIGLPLARSPLPSPPRGAGSRRQARRVMRQGVWLAVIYALVTIIPMWHGESLLLLLGQDAELSRNADLFLKMLAPGMIPTYIYFVLRHYVSAHKRPLPPVIINLFGVVVNILLNGIFIEGKFGMPALGFAGIGLATSLTFTLMAITLALYIHTQKPFRFTRPFARIFRFDTVVMRRLFMVGFPIGVTLLAETGMFIVAGLYIGLYGKVAVAASGIANQIAAVAYMVPLAISQASTIRVGHEAGAQQPQGAVRAAIAASVLTLVITALLTLVLLIWTKPFITAFLNTSDALYDDVMAIAVPMVTIVAIFQIVDGLQSVFTSILRGINDTKWPAVISIFSYWCVGVLSGIVLAGQFGWGPVGVFWGLCFGLTAGSGLLFIRCWMTARKIRAAGRIVLA